MYRIKYYWQNQTLRRYRSRIAKYNLAFGCMILPGIKLEAHKAEKRLAVNKKTQLVY